MVALLSSRPAARRRTLDADAALLEHLRGAAYILRSLRSNVMVATLDLRLVYLNDKAKETLNAIAPVVREIFGLEIADLLGGSIHRFHRDPGRVEKILHDAVLPHHAAFSFGQVTLSTNINDIQDEDGRRIGYIVAWDEISSLRRSIDAVGKLSDEWQSSAAMVEELGVSIQEISRNTSNSAAMSTHMTENLTTSMSLVGQLDSAASEITAISQLINSIADQTHLLALNATIEAARAGDAGKGFAVVASEVKDLASDTASATEKIARQVAAIQEAVVAVRGSTESFAEIVAQVSEYQNSIAAAVEEQAVAARELSSTIANAAAYSDRTVAEIKL